MKKIFTLEDLLDSINSNGNDVDVDVDGVNCIAVCPPVCLTEKVENSLKQPCRYRWKNIA